ncbi:hypothetical protein TeGR_g3789 [Tetraparma gracilis]|uniref:RING-type domain-containing protein n=1 Tax=Tetraparma gracilis TaxID=2962635 RepID=A0ABQ6N9H1_9STRA|nr:hypothetical protein TeGR_g3789 [Tetraparma gracilis]
MLETTAKEGSTAECPICIEALHTARVAVFVEVNEGKPSRRTCPHFVHAACAEEMARRGGGQLSCPLCRVPCDDHRTVPLIEENPRAWFAAVDAAGDGRLSRREVELALVAQFPLDPTRLGRELDEKFGIWDHDGSGHVSAAEFIEPGTGMLDHVRKYLLETADNRV